jgi:hypothetical protein
VLIKMTEAIVDNAKELSLVSRLLIQLRENRVEAMIVTILLYSTGALEKAVLYGAGVC